MIAKGIYPALLTPFDAQGKFNKEALAQLIEYNLAKGVAGFYVTGSTAEVFVLTEAERREVMKAAAEIVHGRCTMIAHVGSISTEYSAGLAAYAEELGYDAVSALPPFYYSFPYAAIRDYYNDILKNTRLPMIIYNIPAFSGVSLTIEQLDELLSHPQIAGVKNTANDYFTLEKIIAHNPDKMVFNGYDETFMAGLAMGADSAIGSTFNFMAEKYIDLRAAFANGKVAEAQALQHQINRIIEALVKVGVMQGEKAILTALGIPMGACRKPFMALTPEQESELLDTVLPLLK